MSESQKNMTVGDWWAAERPRVIALIPQRCSEVIAQATIAMRRAEAENDTVTFADATAVLATAYVKQGEPDVAARLLHKLLDGGGLRFAAVERAVLKAALGDAYEALGKYAEALDLQHEAYTIYASAGDVRGMATARLAMGVVHSRCQDHEIACGHYRAALESLDRLGEQLGMVRALNNIGLDLRHMGRFDESLATFDRAIRLAQAQNLASVIPALVGNRGRTLMAMGRLIEARASFEQHARGAENNMWKRSVLDARLALIEVARAEGEQSSVVGALRDLIPELAQHGLLDQEVKALGFLAEILETDGDAADALSAYKHLRERERAWLDQRANTRLRASILMTDLDAARHETMKEQQLCDELLKANARLAVESAERRARADELYRQSREDALTGLPNRRDYMERLAEECRRAERFQQPLGIAMVDIDRFKRVNDDYGHAAGDQTLVEIARRLRGAMRSGDLVARLGGDEFAVLLPNASVADANVLWERLREAVCGTPVLLANASRRVTISIGVTTYAPGESTNDALSRADMCLYRAKAAGRNRVIAD